MEKQGSNSKRRRHIKHNNSYKIFTASRSELSDRLLVKRQPVRNDPEDGSAKLNWFVEAKERHHRRTSTSTRSLLRLDPTEWLQQLHQQVCGVPARRLLVQQQHLLKAGWRNRAQQPETRRNEKNLLWFERSGDVSPAHDVISGRLGLRVSPQADGPLPHPLTTDIQAEFIRFFGRVGDILVAQEVTKKNVSSMRGSRRKRERTRTRHPNSLLCEAEFLHVQLLALSIPHCTLCRVVTREIHVPAHALVEASVDLGEVRRRLAVHKRGQPQPSGVTPTDGEVRDARKTGDRYQSKNTGQ